MTGRNYSRLLRVRLGVKSRTVECVVLGTAAGAAVFIEGTRRNAAAEVIADKWRSTEFDWRGTPREVFLRSLRLTLGDRWADTPLEIVGTPPARYAERFGHLRVADSSNRRGV